ncbi:IclR family transcriptional regulator [Pacificibacter maritimus]|uniref:IclR family transcriptional regulator n=1 Tax=Pacificibacter maritimus TaxID=762213 RepID=A0A3N4UP28_9RHOB|nr:IclR family transcriptional regulator [Pacificibacter maritimus]RPE72173.1 IclR family transcriptional regulator [Pacificibacter maritimus]
MTTPLNGSLLKGFAILGLLTSKRSEISATNVAADLGLNHATAHRLLLTLEEAGALVCYRRGYFSLGPSLQKLGALAEQSDQLITQARPVIADLAATLNESVMICRLSRKGPTCVAVEASDRPFSVTMNIGTVLPMTVTAQGKLWLASMTSPELTDWVDDPGTLDALNLDQVRRDGYARNRGENETCVGAVSVPVLSGGGETILTLSAFGMVGRFTDDMVSTTLPALFAAAENLTDIATGTRRTAPA